MTAPGTRNPLNIVFMGTPAFAAPPLEALIASEHRVLAVVTQPDRPRGRGRKPGPSPVKTAALAHGVNVLQPDRASSPEFCAEIIDLSPDVLVVVAFGQILKKPLLEAAPMGAVNIHTSLLPKYRGAAPIPWALINGETSTGLSSMKLDEGMDTGPILLQEAVQIHPRDTFGTLHDRLAALSGEFLLRTLRGLMEGTIRGKAQNDSEATYAPKIDTALRQISWTGPAEKICSLIRALDPVPGAVTTVDGMVLKLFSPAIPVELGGYAEPGSVTVCDSGVLEVAAGTGAVRAGSVQLQGRKRMTTEEFLRGATLKKGTLLGK